MERIQPYYRLNKKQKYIEITPATGGGRYFLRRIAIDDEEVPILEKLMARDFKTAILYRRSEKKFIVDMCNDIIEHKG